MSPFRKERHIIEMPKFVTELIDHGGYYSRTIKGWVSWNRKGFSFNELYKVLQDRYSRVTHEETEAIIKLLIQDKIIIPAFTPKHWLVAPKSTTPQTPMPYKPAPAIKKGVRIRRRLKPGECPICGCHVQHKRRHNNKVHSREECQAMMIQKILIQ